MRPWPNDTGLEAAAVQLYLFRNASVARRAALGLALSRDTLLLARNGLRQSRPDADEGELAWAFVAAHYGEELANHVRARLTAAPGAGNELLRALGPVADALDALAVRYCIVGSLASSAYGIARSSVDIDLVTDLRAEHLGALVAALQAAYYVDPGQLEAALADRRPANLVHLATMLKVDLFVPSDRPGGRDTLERARFESFEESVSARKYPVAAPEDVVLAKLEWYRASEERQERQWLDVIGILKVSRAGLDTSDLTRRAEPLGLTALLERAFLESQDR